MLHGLSHNTFAERDRAGSRWLLLLLLLVPWIGASPHAADLEWPEKARDLLYGESLYYYHQGDAFEALTRLNVARARGGIEGHGGHPLLVEGGLMLAYGMTRSAQRHFESDLDEELEARVPLEVRNQAWFYLGKVYYLEQRYDLALEALAKVDVAKLELQNKALYEEWFYLRTQLALQLTEDNQGSENAQAAEAIEFWIGKLPETSLWRFYLRYNQIVRQVSEERDLALVSNALENLLAELSVLEFNSDAETREQQALQEKFRLSLGQLYLQNELFDAAEAHLKRASFTGPFAEQALFSFAIAATHKAQYGLALAALQRLEDKALFTPWLDQVPYALAYLYEQLNDKPLALQAYQAAAQRYDQQIDTLAAQQSALNEAELLRALAMPFDAGEGEDNSALAEYKALSLGTEQLENDPYGRLKVLPQDFAYAQLLADERFQLGLRDLHELYKLKASLLVREKQLQSFELMLETRARQRQARLAAVSTTLDNQDADTWNAQQKQYAKRIEQALSEQDARFFMTEEQMEFAALIDAVSVNLDLLSDAMLDEDEVQEYQQKLSRAKAYFHWWVEDQYGANRWAAQKQLRLLNRAMEEFNGRHAALQFALSDHDFQRDLELRVREGYQRLKTLEQSLDMALAATRAELLALVSSELEAQVAQVKQYRLASRHAIARLADQLYQEQQASETTPDAPADAADIAAEQVAPNEVPSDAESGLPAQESAQ